jgi:hypothetical protein
LVTQYWNIYSIINEQGKTVRDVWDGVNLRFTFRRTISSDVMAQWLEVLQIAESLIFSDAEYAIIWQYNSSGKYAVQTLYAIVNERGVRQNFALVMWRIPIPPRLHVFLWLLANNKVLTRDNLAKRRQVDDKTCLFCAELESVSHLFFNCCVARMAWNDIYEMTNTPVIIDFESMGRMWVKGKKGRAFNVLTSIVVWALWKLRNNMCFKGKCWSRVEVILREVAKFIRNWTLVNRSEEVEMLETWTVELERRSVRPPRLMWCQTSRSSASENGVESSDELNMSSCMMFWGMLSQYLWWWNWL